MNHLPSLNALHTFESAARHLSFKLAAEELYLTPSAVSKQIRSLEEELGYRLFHRLTRKLVLTEEGKQLVGVVRSALTLISDRVEGLQVDDTNRILKISVPPSFAMKWLIPRLGKFKTAFPEIVLEIDAESRYVDLREAGVDLVIRYTHETAASAFTETQMMDEALFPVGAPKLLDQGEEIQQIEDLQAFCFLHTPEKTRWTDWFKATGASELVPANEMFFSRADLAVQATIEGQGIMIAREALVSDDIAMGRLRRLFNYPVKDTKSYRILCLVEQAQKNPIATFRNWLLDEAKLFKGP